MASRNNIPSCFCSLTFSIFTAVKIFFLSTSHLQWFVTLICACVLLQFFSIKFAFLSLQSFKNTFNHFNLQLRLFTAQRRGVDHFDSHTGRELEGVFWFVFVVRLYLHRACWCFDFSSLILIFQEWCVWCLRWIVGYCHVESTLLTEKLNVFLLSTYPPHWWIPPALSVW